MWLLVRILFAIPVGTYLIVHQWHSLRFVRHTALLSCPPGRVHTWCCSPLLPSWPCSHLVLLSSLALLAVFTPGLHTAGADALLEARARVVAAPVDLARVARPDEAPPHPTARSQRATRLAALLLCWLLWSRSLPQLHVGLQAPHGGAQDPALWCATHRRRRKPGPRGRSSPL